MSGPGEGSEATASIAGSVAPEPLDPPPVTIDGDWEPWFAWHPVRLYMSGRLAWLCRIHRRAIHRSGMAMWDYTDHPETLGKIE
jgi:hypothetical protein